jgi:hypothetical protein
MKKNVILKRGKNKQEKHMSEKINFNLFTYQQEKNISIQEKENIINIFIVVGNDEFINAIKMSLELKEYQEKNSNTNDSFPNTYPDLIKKLILEVSYIQKEEKNKKHNLIFILDQSYVFEKESTEKESIGKESPFLWTLHLYEIIKVSPEINERDVYFIIISPESVDEWRNNKSYYNDLIPNATEISQKLIEYYDVQHTPPVVIKIPFEISTLKNIIENIIKTEDKNYFWYKVENTKTLSYILTKEESKFIENWNIIIIDDEIKIDEKKPEEKPKNEIKIFCKENKENCYQNCPKLPSYYKKFLEEFKINNNISKDIKIVKCSQEMEFLLTKLDTQKMDEDDKKIFENADFVLLDIISEHEKISEDIGIQICKKLKKYFPYLPIFAVSNAGTTSSHSSGFELEPYYYISKVIKAGAISFIDKSDLNSNDSLKIQRYINGIKRNLSGREWLKNYIKHYTSNKRFILDLTGKYIEIPYEEKIKKTYILKKLFSEYSRIILQATPSEGLSGASLFYVTPEEKITEGIYRTAQTKIVKLGPKFSICNEKILYDRCIKEYIDNYVARVETEPVIADEWAGIIYTTVGDEKDFEKGKYHYPITLKKFIKENLKTEDGHRQIKKVINDLMTYLLSEKGLYRDKHREKFNENQGREIYKKLLYFLPPEVEYEYISNEQGKDIELKLKDYKISKNGVILRGYKKDNNLEKLVRVEIKDRKVSYEILNDLRLKPGRVIKISGAVQSKTIEKKKFLKIEKILKQNNLIFSVGTCHGDIHLDNILVSRWETDSPNLWLIDFANTHKDGLLCVEFGMLESAVLYQLIEEIIIQPIIESKSLNDVKHDDVTHDNDKNNKIVDSVNQDFFEKIYQKIPYGSFEINEELKKNIDNFTNNPELSFKLIPLIKIIGTIRQKAYNIGIKHKEYAFGLLISSLRSIYYLQRDKSNLIKLFSKIFDTM